MLATFKETDTKQLGRRLFSINSNFLVRISKENNCFLMEQMNKNNVIDNAQILAGHFDADY